MEEICKFTKLLPSEKNEGWQSSAQRDTLVKLFKIPFVADNFWLAGGTCLSAMYLGHRQSEDLDLFTTRERIDSDDGQKIVDILRAKFEFDMPTVISSNFTSILIEGVKVEFVSDMFAYKCTRPGVMLNGTVCKVDSWENLCVAKFSAFLSRTSDKDIADIGAILKTAKNDSELKEMSNFLVCETRKRDSMADELTKISEIAAYASQSAKNVFYRDIFSKFYEIIVEFQKEIGETLRG